MLSRRQRADSRRGAVLIFAAILLISLLAITALAVDIGFLCCVRTEAQAVADAAAMAGAQGLPTSPAQVRANAQAVAQLNTVNGKYVQLLSTDIQLGSWNPNSQTFSVLGGLDESGASACQVTVSQTAARGNPATLFFGKIFGKGNQDVVSSAVAGGLRWDVVIVQDITESYTTDLHYAVTGDQYALDALYKYSPSSDVGIVQFTGWGSTVAPLQTIRDSYGSLSTSIQALRITNTTWPGGVWTKGGNGTTVGIMPPSSGTDLSAGLAQALLLFNASTYNPPAGTNKAIIISTDGVSNAASNNDHPGKTSAQLLTIAQQTADAAWAQGISVFAVLYDHDGDINTPAAVQSLVRGKGSFIDVKAAPYLPAALQSIITNDLLYSLLK